MIRETCSCGAGIVAASSWDPNNRSAVEEWRRSHRCQGGVTSARISSPQMSHPAQPGSDYRIALRPDDRDADPMDPRTLLDDIVVMRPHMFRAEQMDPSTWWVACYLDENTDDRICWTVTAHARPKHLAWTGYEYPDAVIYEHDLKAAPS